MKRTSSGKLFLTDFPKKRLGKQIWTIESVEKLDQHEVEEIIELFYPSTKYGTSGFYRKRDNLIEVITSREII